MNQKIEDYRDPGEAFSLWDAYRNSDYQKSDDLMGYRARLAYERERTRVGAELAEAGPVSLVACLAFSLEFNDRIQSSRAALRAVGGEQIIAQSRFLPGLVYALRHESDDVEGAVSTNTTDHIFRITQRLLEFGRDNPVDVSLRAEEREALFRYEDTVRDALTGVRKTFFTILLRQQQLAERRKLLEDFRSHYEQIRELEETRRALEVDVLTARLNVLNEEARINALEREIFRKRNDLLYLLGFPVGMSGVRLNGGTIEQFDLAADDAVQLGLRKSSAVAQARAEAAEQARVLREVIWDYAPTVGLQAGWRDAQNAAGVEMDTDDGLYTLSSFAETHSEEWTDLFDPETDRLGAEEEGWFVDLAVELPVFEGLRRQGRYRQEKARFEEAQHTLRDRMDDVELRIRKRLETVHERRKEVDILKETVEISRKRLKVQERLKELGKISDNELETFRTRFFQDQDAYFTQQIELVEAQEDLRFEMRYYEPLP